MGRTDCQVAQIGIRGETHPFEGVRKLNESRECIFEIAHDALARQHHDLNVVLKVDQHDELLCVLDKHAAPHRIVVVDACRVVNLCALNFYSYLFEPLLLFVFDARNLMILPAELTKHLDYSPLDL